MLRCVEFVPTTQVKKMFLSETQALTETKALTKNINLVGMNKVNNQMTLSLTERYRKRIVCNWCKHNVGDG